MADNPRRIVDWLASTAGQGYQRAAWEPLVDVYRGPSAWLVKFDLAGVSPADIELSACGRRLTVRGVRRDWCIEQGQSAYSMEISYSRFERSLELPFDLEAARISTEYRDGMLLVRLAIEQVERP